MPDGPNSQTVIIDVPVELAFWLHGFIALTGLLLVLGFLALRLMGRRPSSALIAIFLLFALQALANIAYQLATPAWMPHLGWLIQLLELRAVVGFVFGPLALFYVREFIDPTWRPSWRELWHAVPAILMASTLYLWPEWEINIYAYASAAVLLVYAGLAGLHLRRSGYLRQADADQKLWLWLSGGLFLLLLGVNAVATNFNCKPIVHADVRLYQALLLVGILALMYVFVLAGFWRGFVLFPAETTVPGNAPSSEVSASQASLAVRFQTVMEEAELWRDPDMSLGMAAAQLTVSPRRLSLAVRDVLGVSVIDWVNARRIAMVQEILRQDPQSSQSLLDMALDAGFSSKPTFNRAFSKFAGMTPSAFRDGLRESSH